MSGEQTRVLAWRNSPGFWVGLVAGVEEGTTRRHPIWAQVGGRELSGGALIFLVRMGGGNESSGEREQAALGSAPWPSSTSST